VRNTGKRLHKFRHYDGKPNVFILQDENLNSLFPPPQTFSISRNHADETKNCIFSFVLRFAFGCFFNNFFRVACQSFFLRNLTWRKYNLEKQLISMGKQNLEVEIIEVKRQGDLFF